MFYTSNISAQFYTIEKTASIDGEYIQLSVDLPKRYDKVAWTNGMEGKTIKVPACEYNQLIGCLATCPDGCKSELGVYVSEGDVPKVDIKKEDESCFGMNDGHVKIDIPDDVDIKNVIWSDGKERGTRQRNQLAPGDYSVTVTGPFGNEKVKSFTINKKEAYALNHDRIKMMPPKGKNKGIQVEVSEEKGDMYAWSTGMNGSNVPLSIGVHSLQITNGNRCGVFDFPVDEFKPMEVASNILNHVTCAGSHSGQIEVSIKGGQAPYLLSVKGKERLVTTRNITIGDLKKGSYTIIIKDAYGEKQKIKHRVKGENVIEVKVDNAKSPTCTGGKNGAITLSTDGAIKREIGLYDAENNLIAKGTEHLGLSEGEYIAKATGVDGCEYYEIIHLEAPNFEIDILAEHPSCSGLNDGWLEVLPKGGKAPFSIDWLKEAEGVQKITDLEAGKYSCTIKDANGCIKSIDTVLKEPQAVAIEEETIVVKNPTCFGRSDGSVSVNLKRRGVSCEWIDHAKVGKKLGTIPAGKYRVLIKDKNACSMHEVELTEPPVIDLSLNVHTNENGFNVSCNGSKDGAVAINNIRGGNDGDYKVRLGRTVFTWNQDSSKKLINHLKPGNYTLRIRDNKGCSYKNIVTITEPIPMEITTDVSSYGDYNIKCHGDSNGSIKACVKGRTNAHRYAWYNQTDSLIGNDSVLLNVPKGRYRLEVADNYGCGSKVKIKLEEPPRLSIKTIDSNAKVFGKVLTKTKVKGGHGDYDYTFNENEKSKKSWLKTKEHYSVMVKDKMGCTDIRPDVYFNEPKMKTKEVGDKPRKKNQTTRGRGRQKCPAWKKTFGKKVLQWINMG